MNDSFSTRDILEVNGKRYQIRSLAKLGRASISSAFPIR